MLNWPTHFAVAVRRLVAGKSQVKVPRKRRRPTLRMPHLVSFAHVMLVLVTDRTADRWLPTTILESHAGASDDLCVLA